MRERLNSKVALISKLGDHLVSGGGKRLRPAVLLLGARALCGHASPQAHLLAGAIECIHSATLLHDDVVDASVLRRGSKTANDIWGDGASILTGDYIYSRSFQIMVDAGEMRVMRIMADTTNAISEGEVMQLMNRHKPEVSEDTYNEVIRRKTAILFEAAAQLGAISAQATDSEEKAVAAYGLHLGMAFQLIDDALDYESDAETMGKNIGDDLAEGKPTLPLIHALREASKADRQTLEQIIKQGSADDIETVKGIIESTGAIQYTADRAKEAVERAKSALCGLPDSVSLQSLNDLADFSVSRKF